MCRSIVSVLLYLAVCFISLLVFVNFISIAEANVIGELSPFWQTVVKVTGWASLVIIAIIPFMLLPFPLIARSWGDRKDVRFSHLLKQTPHAYLRCLVGALHATFTLIVVGFPLAIGVLVLTAMIITGNAISVEFAVVAVSTGSLCWILGRQVISRLLSPFVSVMSGESPFHALRLSFEIVRSSALRLTLIIVSSVILITALCYIVPISGTEIILLINGSVVANGGNFEWLVLVRLIPFIACGGLIMLTLCSAIARGLTERQLERLLDFNISRFSVAKLALQGYLR